MRLRGHQTPSNRRKELCTEQSPQAQRSVTNVNLKLCQPVCGQHLVSSLFVGNSMRNRTHHSLREAPATLLFVAKPLMGFSINDVYVCSRYLPNSEPGGSRHASGAGALATWPGTRADVCASPLSQSPRPVPATKPLSPAKLAPSPPNSPASNSLPQTTSQQLVPSTTYAHDCRERAVERRGAGSYSAQSSSSPSGLVFLTPTERMLLVSCMDLDPHARPAVLPLSLLGGEVGVGKPDGHSIEPPSAVVTKGRINSSRAAVAVSLMGMHLLVCMCAFRLQQP